MERHQPFHLILKRERELRGWTQAELADKLQIDAKTVGRWETNKALPQPSQRRLLSDVLGKTLPELGLFENDKDDSATSKGPREDWGEAPDTSLFCGRDKQLETLTQWVVVDHCRIVAIMGMGGVGKTALCTQLARQIKGSFECVFWRSLHNAPSPEHILQQCIQFVSGQPSLTLPTTIADQITLLIQHLRERRCLLIFDNIESLLQPGQRAGNYSSGNEGYGQLIQRIGESEHASCLLLTSREKTKELVRLEGKRSPVRGLPLYGVRRVEGQAILKERELFGTEAQWQTLIDLYSGNPLALKLVAEFIEGIFGGHIADFLTEGKAAFGDITDLLDQQFDRLSRQEQEILYWLTIEREALPLEAIRANFVQPLSNDGALLEALISLQRRSLIEVREGRRFVLQPVILEYITNRLTRQMCEDFTNGSFTAWASYALLKSHSKDYVRATQVRFLLNPVAEELLATSGKESVVRKLQRQLTLQRQSPPQQQGYLAGNVLNLLIHLDCDLRGSDFSLLTIRQAYLQNVTLQDVNFAYAHFVDTIFTNTFGNILSVAFSPRGTFLATGTSTGDIWLYSATEGTPLHTFTGHSDGTWSLAFSADERILASSSDDQTIRLWDIAQEECRYTLQGHTNRVRALALSPDGTLLASGSDDQTIRLWNASTGEHLQTLRGHSDRIWGVAFNPNGTMLASGSTDGTVRLWDLHSTECRHILRGHTHNIRSVAFSPDGNLVASGSDDQTIRLWNAHTGACERVLTGHINRVWAVAFSPDGTMLASGSEDQTVRLWASQSGQCLTVLQGHTHGVRSVAFTPDGRTLASGGEDQTLRLWDVEARDRIKTLQGYTNRIRALSFSQTEHLLASCNEDQTISVWDVKREMCLQTIQDRSHGVRAIALSPNGQLIASGGEDQTVRLWESSSGHCLATFQGHTNWVWTVAFSPDGTRIASAGEDHTIRLWSIQQHNSLATLQGHTGWIRSVAFSPDGELLASAGDDNIIHLWNVQTGLIHATLKGHTQRIRSVAFSPDGQLLASGSEDHTIHLWQVATGRCLHTLTGHTDWVRTVAFSPRRHLLASGSEDLNIRLWDTQTGACVHILQGHNNRVRSISFNADGQLLASGGGDGIIVLWHIQEPAQASNKARELRNEKPYERMNIVGVTGLTDAQKIALKALGATETPLRHG